MVWADALPPERGSRISSISCRVSPFRVLAPRRGSPVVHAAEFAPLLEEYAIPLDVNAYYDQAAAELERLVDETLGEGGAEHVLRLGTACPTIATEVTDWNADLVVVGSHGKGWVDRMLIGSTAERLLNKLPTSALVVPVGPPTRPSQRQSHPRGRTHAFTDRIRSAPCGTSRWPRS